MTVSFRLSVVFLVLSASLSSANPSDTLALDYARGKRVLDEAGTLRDLEAARTIFVDLVARDRNYAPAYVGLGEYEQEMTFFDPRNAAKRENSARKFAEHALKLDPSLFDGMVLMAGIAVHDGDFDVARTWADRADLRRPGADEVKVVRADIAMRERDFRTGVAIARDVAANANEKYIRVEADLLLFNIYARQGFNEQAEATLRQTVKLYPDKSLLHGLYAGFMVQRRRVDDAITEAERAVALSRDPFVDRVLATAYAVKANALWSSRAYAEASLYIDKAMPFMGDDADAFYSAGNFYARAADKLGKPELRERAVAAFKKALEIAPDHANARRALEKMTQNSAH